MKSLKVRRQYYDDLKKRKFTPEEIIRLMPDDELRMNVKRGGILAIEEKMRRNLDIGQCIICHNRITENDMIYDEFIGDYVCQICDLKHEIANLEQ